MKPRNTFQKKIVRETVGQLDHPSAGAVYKAVHEMHSSISRATVFRICASLANSGELMRFPVAGGEDRFDVTLTPHYHVVCTECGRVADIPLPYSDELVKSAAQVSDFTVDDYLLEFKGLCPECSLKTNIKSGGKEL